MRIAQLLSMSMAMIAASDPRFGAAADMRSYRRPSLSRRLPRIYVPGEYRSAGWDEVKAEAYRAARQARKSREWLRQHKVLACVRAAPRIGAPTVWF